MTRIAWIAVLGIGLVLVPSWKAQEEWRNACLQKCVSQRAPGDPELQTQEIASLEKETARAIQSNSGTFFYRVYSDEFAGTLSHGQQVNKTQWIEVIESRAVKYESFHATDIKVRVFQDTAVATCLWSSRSIVKGERISSQLRVVHVYVNTPSGWHVVSAQATNLPPDVHQPL
jgi:hypothetical protein